MSSLRSNGVCIIGLTGGIGTGKSTVSKIFKTLGVPVYDSDASAKRLMHSSKMLAKEISRQFGSEIYDDGILNRQTLASIVFGDSEKLKILNNLVHPAVHVDFDEWCEQQSAPMVIKEAAVLFESGAYKFCDKVIAVNANESVRIERVKQRDGSRVEEIKKRMASQWPADKVASMADFVIQNGTNDALIPQVMDIYKTLGLSDIPS